MITFMVSGMTCGHCRAAVEQAVHAVAPGAAVTVDLGAGTVAVEGDGDPARLAAAIREEGYVVTGAAA